MNYSDFMKCNNYQEVFEMYKEIAYTIRPEKKDDFLKKLYSTSKKMEDWDRIKDESKIVDKKRLDELFKGTK